MPVLSRSAELDRSVEGTGVELVVAVSIGQLDDFDLSVDVTPSSPLKPNAVKAILLTHNASGGQCTSRDRKAVWIVSTNITNMAPNAPTQEIAPVRPVFFGKYASAISTCDGA